jgi:protoporphyrinogen oxidase
MNISDRTMPFVGAIEHTNFVSPEEYGGKHLLYLSNYVSHTDPKYLMSDKDLVEFLVAHLHRINPKFTRDWVEDWHVFREDAAQPLITTYYSKRIPDHRTPITGLYLANTAQIYPEDRGTNYSVRLGQTVSKLIQADT